MSKLIRHYSDIRKSNKNAVNAAVIERQASSNLPYEAGEIRPGGLRQMKQIMIIDDNRR